MVISTNVQFFISNFIKILKGYNLNAQEVYRGDPYKSNKLLKTIKKKKEKVGDKVLVNNEKLMCYFPCFSSFVYDIL